MEQVDWKKVRSVHLIGIGGVGISALSRLLFEEGVAISGTEDNESRETLDELREKGVSISLNLDPVALPAADCYVYSDAWLTRHPEVLAEARSRNVPTLSYFEALGQIAGLFKLIAVAGAHGKTSTTAMLIDVLEAAGLDPVGVVGSLRAKTKKNFRAGRGEYFVVEADEYMRHFLNFNPWMLVITNIDADHLDYYKDIADIQSAFRELALRVPPDGFVICDPSSETVKPVIEGLTCTVLDYKKYFDPKLPLKVLPLHRTNAAAVLAAASALSIPEKVTKEALADFAGTWRRFEYKGTTSQGALLYDDYGHHPTEIFTTLASVKEMFPGKRLVVVFHPHLYSRTKILLNDFARAFKNADEVAVAPIFAAREAPDPAISNVILADRIREQGKTVTALDSLDAATDFIRTHAHSGDVVLTIGAGDIYKAGEKALKAS